MLEPATDGRAATFIGDLSFAHRFDGHHGVGWADFTDELREPRSGQARASVLATLADIFTGALASQLCAPRIALTVDLSLRVVGDASGDRLEATSSVLRTGRTITLAGTDFVDPESGRLVAVSVATFLPSPRPQDVIPLRNGFSPSGRRMGRPFVEQMGTRVLAPGLVEMDRDPYVQQPTGTLQGGALALLVEVAAESLVDARVVELDLRYLSAVRVGPGRASSEALGADTVRVEVRDPGNEDRPTTLALVRVAR
jgi:acyl-coenzyme A thioesterase PaaI-like protein